MVQNGNNVHLALAELGCIVCHLPHSSEYPYLLNDSYSTKKYQAGTIENYGLCFNCHDTDLLMEESTLYGTNFRDGSQNLHFLHIKGETGRNCNLCHSVHAARNSSLQ